MKSRLVFLFVLGFLTVSPRAVAGLITVILSDGTTAQLTSEQALQVASFSAPVPAGKLRVGDVIVLPGGKSAEIIEITRDDEAHAEPLDLGIQQRGFGFGVQGSVPVVVPMLETNPQRASLKASTAGVEAQNNQERVAGIADSPIVQKIIQLAKGFTEIYCKDPESMKEFGKKVKIGLEVDGHDPHSDDGELLNSVLRKAFFCGLIFGYMECHKEATRRDAFLMIPVLLRDMSLGSAEIDHDDDQIICHIRYFPGGFILPLPKANE